MTAGVPGLGLSGLFVMLSVILMPAWRSRHRSRAQVRPVHVLPLLGLAVAIAAVTWLTWEAAMLGLHHSSTNDRDASFLGSLFGVPVILVSMGILVSVIGAAELVAHIVETRPTPAVPPVQRLTPASVASVEPPTSGHAWMPPPLALNGRVRVSSSRRLQKGSRMFGRRKRQDAQAIETIREHLSAADAHSRALLSDAIARMELRLSSDLEQRERLQVSTDTSIDTLRYSVTSGAADVARSLAQVANMCAMVAEQIEADRLERRALTEAIELLARPALPPPEERSRVIGGTVFASPAISHDDEISIVGDQEDRAEPAPRNSASDDMWCRDDDQWVGGVEIANISNDDDTIRYWIRRRSDGYIFPRSFDATELRFLPEAPSPSLGEPQGHWSTR